MVQVSYPGVYISEIPSGSRTIAGVSTSIALFVGMAQQGPINEPKRVFGFLDYARIFSDDTSQGEMTDQVRQFFLNGGQEAVIVRTARNFTASAVTLQSEAGSSVLTLTARSPGQTGNLLRARVDYDTQSPNHSFNLTVYREEKDASGAIRVASSETFKDLSMDAAAQRYAVNVINASSTLVEASLPEGVTLTAQNGVSVAGRLFRVATGANPLAAALGVAGTACQFRLQHGDVWKTIAFTIPSSPTDATVLTAMNGALDAQFGAGAVEADLEGPTTVGSHRLLVLRSAQGRSLTAAVGDANDVAKTLQLGAAQGGLEIGAFANSRPAPTGLVSLLSRSGNSLESLLDLIQLTGDGFGSLTLTNRGTLPTPLPGATPLAGETNPSLAQLKTRLRELARVIAANLYRAELHGLRLALLPTGGPAEDGYGLTVTVSGLDAAGARALFATTVTTGSPPGGTSRSGNVGAYSLGVTPALGSQTAPQAGDDGSAPEPEDYDAAFAVVEKKVDLFNLMVLPRSAQDLDGREDVWGAASVFCRDQRAFLLVDMSRSLRDVEAVNAANEALRVGIVKDHSAVYWPSLSISKGGEPTPIDPSGSIAGLMARIDSSRGVWKAPAGTEADIRGIRGLEVAVSDNEQGKLNPQAVNVLRAFPTGVVCWGARTMDGYDNSGNDDYRYVPVRRLTLMIEESLYRGLQFAVFEPNGEELWSQLRLAAGAFMNTLFRRGAFAGKTTRDAYFVKVDSETTTQNDINLGIVNVLVGFAPLKPAEFVVVTIQQKAGQVQV